MLAEKFHEDDHHSIEDYSLVSGVPIKEILNLEIKVFELLEFKLFGLESIDW